MPDMSIKALNSGAAPETCGIELVGSGSSTGACDAGCSTLQAAQDDWTDGQGDDAFWGADPASYHAIDARRLREKRPFGP